jgi:PAS domain S-box-containing protein
MSSSATDGGGFEPLPVPDSNGLFDNASGEERLLPILLKAVEDASEAILVTEAQLEAPGPRILWVNPAFTEITGYERDEVMGQTPRILQGPNTEASVLGRLRTRLAAGERFEGETINYRKDGTEFVNHWSIAPVRGSDETIAYWVSIQRDVTEKRQLEREVLRVQEEERRRIGRDLHDSVGSDLVSAGMLLDNVLDRYEDHEALAGSLQSVREAIERGYEALRELTRGLSPVDLSEGSLTIALENLAARSPNVHAETGEVDLDVVLADWDVEALAHLYWIVKEATTNALEHAAADTIRIRASREESSLVLAVEDDGVGMEAVDRDEQGWGLRTMQYRADLLSAELDVGPRPGGGTRVACRLPV